MHDRTTIYRGYAYNPFARGGDGWGPSTLLSGYSDFFRRVDKKTNIPPTSWSAGVRDVGCVRQSLGSMTLQMVAGGRNESRLLSDVHEQHQ